MHLLQVNLGQSIWCKIMLFTKIVSVWHSIFIDQLLCIAFMREL